MRDFIANNKRFLSIIGLGVLGLVVVLVVAAVVVSAAGGRGSNDAQSPTPGATRGTAAQPSGSSTPSSSPSLPAPSDIASVAAVPAVPPAVSADYPAIPATQKTQPDLYANAFATELYTQKYATTTRDSLMSWAQYESTPVLQPGLDEAGRAKLPLISLTDLGWEPDAQATPIPPVGPWLSLAARSGYTTVADVKVQTDPAWEQTIAGGYKPPDPLLTVRIVSATVTLHTTVSGQPVESKTAVALKVQLGTSVRGAGYAFVASGSYVVKTVS